jgi:hypothetical protein
MGVEGGGCSQVPQVREGTGGGRGRWLQARPGATGDPEHTILLLILSVWDRLQGAGEVGGEGGGEGGGRCRGGRLPSAPK